MFQPSMMGNLEAGLAETMEYVFKHFSPEDQLLLANNVFLTGGSSQFPGKLILPIMLQSYKRIWDNTRSLLFAKSPTPNTFFAYWKIPYDGNGHKVYWKFSRFIECNNSSFLYSDSIE